VYTLMQEIELKPSRYLRAGLLLALGLCFWALSQAALPVGIQFALGTLASAGMLWQWRRNIRLPVLRVTIDGGLQCRDAAGDWQDLALEDDSFVSSWLLVLRYRKIDTGGTGSSVTALTLWPDSAAAGDLRRIRVALRWAPRTRWDTSDPDGG
jgi:toxin CptA